MRKILFFLLLLLFAFWVVAADVFKIRSVGQLVRSFRISMVDSVSIDSAGVVLRVHLAGTSVEEFRVNEIEEMYFTRLSDTIAIVFSEAGPEVSNPYEGLGVEVTSTNGNVLVNSTVADRELVLHLSGNTGAGSVRLFSAYRVEVMLENLHLTGDGGPAINIQSKKKNTITLIGNSVLADSEVYLAAAEDRKATFFSEGQLLFRGTGSLSVSSKAHHAICSDDYIKMESGEIRVNSVARNGLSCNDDLTIEGGKLVVLLENAASKALKSDQSVLIRGGEITLTTRGGVTLSASGSGMDPSYSTAIKAAANVTIEGGSITIDQSGAGNKGISADGDVLISGGTINILNSGAAAKYTNASGLADAYSAAAVTADGNVLIKGGVLISKSTGVAGKGIKADGTLTISAHNDTIPTVDITTTGARLLVSGTDYTAAKALKSDGALLVSGGNLTIHSADDGIKSETQVTIGGGIVSIPASVEGIESKVITIDGGELYVTASGDGLNATMGTKAGGVEQNDGSVLYINGGYLVVSGTKGDAIDSNGNVVINGGVTVVHGPPASPEEDIDVNGSLTVNGGWIIGATTNSNMNKAFSATSGQYAIYTKSASPVAANTIFRIQDSFGNEIVTFKPLRSAYGFHFSSPLLKTGISYSIYHGGTYTGGTNSDGVLSGGSYGGGTLKKTFTLSSKSTTISY